MIFRALACLLCICVAAPLAAFETRAKAAIVIDVTTGTVLYEKEADVSLPPASMSKLMTLNMLFEALADGRVRLDDTGGNEVFHQLGHISLQPLVRNIEFLFQHLQHVLEAVVLLQQLPDAGAHLVQAKISLPGQVQQHGFSVDLLRQHIG